MGLPLAERKTNPPPRLGFKVCNTKTNPGPFYFLSCKYSIFHSSYLYPPALSTLLLYLGIFNMNYITFRIIEIFKTYLFKKKLWRKINNVVICTRIFCFNWNIQNKIIIGHWDVELAMILSVFLFFQVFTGVLIPACEHPKEKNSSKWWLVIRTFLK